MRLHDLAHARSGDKGNTSDITVVAFDASCYARLVAVLSAASVYEHFRDLGLSSVDRYELPGLHALKFVLHDALAGGVTAGLGLDAHGKCLSSCLLEMSVLVDVCGTDQDQEGGP